MRNSKQIRSSFVDFFKSKGHRPILSSSTIPYNDPTILFTNAGMNQFKGIFLGQELVDYNRAVTVQKVIRAGGKHNDLENVGFTARHHTFFEMLGNFSFGDYFKEQAILFAWEWLVDVLKIQEEKLAVSVYHKDQQAYDLWHKKIGLSEDRIAKLGEKDNFWSMGDTGPCGPCSEIHYDLYPEKSNLTPRECCEQDNGRFLEVWNLVFMEFDRSQDGILVPLPKPSIDTGCGLERISSVLQGVLSNYDTDLFKPLIERIAFEAKYTYGKEEEKDVACRVLSDHVRSASFILADGAMPSNEGRGYVLRRIIRRALHYADRLNLPPYFFTQLADFFTTDFSALYPELKDSKNLIAKKLTEEESRFSSTLKRGLEKIHVLIRFAEEKQQKNIPAREVFKLYDTYGFPLDLTRDILREKNLHFSQEEFDREMNQQREKARLESNKKNVDGEQGAFYMEAKNKLHAAQASNQIFLGYDQLQVVTDALQIYQDDKIVEQVNLKNDFHILLKETPFYATAGGQEGDVGWILVGDMRFKVLKTHKPFAHFHLSLVAGNKQQDQFLHLTDFQQLTAKVDEKIRQNTARNHTATHLLHSALRSVLGTHIKQAGSFVNHQKLRFDFTHHAPLNPEEWNGVEEFVVENIAQNFPVEVQVLSLEEALKTGALAFFGDKYGASVRVVKAGESSKELCGGTHVKATGVLGYFKILSETAVASGVRRVEALTYLPALEKVQHNAQLVKEISKVVLSSEENVLKSVSDQSKKIQHLEQVIHQYKKEMVARDLDLVFQSSNPDQVFLVDVPQTSDLDTYLEILNDQHLEKIILFIQPLSNKKLILAVVVGKKAKTTLSAKDMVVDLAKIIQGKGGGQNHYAQCSGDIAFLNKAKEHFLSFFP